jgi:hypothetical protein
LIGLTPIDEGVDVLHEVREVLMHLFVGDPFGVVAAAVQRDVDAKDELSQLASPAALKVRL